MTDTAINIGLHVGGLVIDLRIPRFVTIEHLCEIIAAGLATLGISLPPNFILKPLNKAIKLKPATMLSEYPLSNGDQLAVVPAGPVHKAH